MKAKQEEWKENLGSGEWEKGMRRHRKLEKKEAVGQI
jgi:hypothetical protein